MEEKLESVQWIHHLSLLQAPATATNSTDGPPGSQSPLPGWLRGTKGAKDRPKELRDREKLERRLTDVRVCVCVWLLWTHKACS